MQPIIKSVLAFFSSSSSSFPPLLPPPPPPPPPCPRAPLLYGFLLFTCMPLSFSLCLPLALPPFSRVISLSYVCPSLYVCVPPLFVSDSFSREIRDAYLVPLSSTGAVALSYTAWRWPRRQKPHPLIMRSSYPDRCQGPDAEWKPRPHLSTGQFEASARMTVIDCLINQLTLFNV